MVELLLKFFMAYKIKKNFKFSSLIILELVGLDNNELTKESFIKLNAIEANREDKHEREIFQQLANLGFNRSLEIDQVLFFQKNVQYTFKLNFRVVLF